MAYDEEVTEKAVSAIDEIRRISKVRLEECNVQLAEMAEQSARMDMRRDVLGQEVETLHRILDASRRDDQKDVDRPSGPNPSGGSYRSSNWQG